jgi:glycosyltransferase involved in cell wall biosynthesis
VGWLREETLLYRALDRLARGYARRAGAALVPTPGLADPVRGHGAATVTVVPGAVFDAARGDEVRARARAELGVQEETCLFVYIGALGVANGLQALLDAAVEVGDDARTAFVVIGDGSDRARLEQEVHRRRITSVRILPPIAKERVPDVLAAGDVCLHLLRPDPLFAGALPSKVLEYLGAHRPGCPRAPGARERRRLRPVGRAAGRGAAHVGGDGRGRAAAPGRAGLPLRQRALLPGGQRRPARRRARRGHERA